MRYLKFILWTCWQAVRYVVESVVLLLILLPVVLVAIPIGYVADAWRTFNQEKRK